MSKSSSSRKKSKSTDPHDSQLEPEFPYPKRPRHTLDPSAQAKKSSSPYAALSALESTEHLPKPNSSVHRPTSSLKYNPIPLGTSKPETVAARGLTHIPRVEPTKTSGHGPHGTGRQGQGPTKSDKAHGPSKSSSSSSPIKRRPRKQAPQHSQPKRFKEGRKKETEKGEEEEEEEGHPMIKHAKRRNRKNRRRPANQPPETHASPSKPPSAQSSSEDPLSSLLSSRENQDRMLHSITSALLSLQPTLLNRLLAAVPEKERNRVASRWRDILFPLPGSTDPTCHIQSDMDMTPMMQVASNRFKKSEEKEKKEEEKNKEREEEEKEEEEKEEKEIPPSGTLRHDLLDDNSSFISMTLTEDDLDSIPQLSLPQGSESDEDEEEAPVQNHISSSVTSTPLEGYKAFSIRKGDHVTSDEEDEEEEEREDEDKRDGSSIPMIGSSQLHGAPTLDVGVPIESSMVDDQSSYPSKVLRESEPGSSDPLSSERHSPIMMATSQDRLPEVKADTDMMNGNAAHPLENGDEEDMETSDEEYDQDLDYLSRAGHRRGSSPTLSSSPHAHPISFQASQVLDAPTAPNLYENQGDGEESFSSSSSSSSSDSSDSSTEAEEEGEDEISSSSSSPSEANQPLFSQSRAATRRQFTSLSSIIASDRYNPQASIYHRENMWASQQPDGLGSGMTSTAASSVYHSSDSSGSDSSDSSDDEEDGTIGMRVADGKPTSVPIHSSSSRKAKSRPSGLAALSQLS